MPGNVGNAVPATVLPQILCQQFSRTLDFPVLVNEYRNGEAQTGAEAATDRSRWRFTGRWTNSVRQAFRAFYVARAGGLEAFYMYDPWESGFTHDPTGVSPTGRHTVRFEGSWQDALELGRAGGSMELVEIA